MKGDTSNYEVAVAGSRYDVTVTRVVPNGLTIQQVLKADPRRCYFEVWSLAGGGTVGQLLPVAVPPAGFTFGSVSAPISEKWKDAPALATVAWYGAGTDANGWLTIECFLQG